MEVVSQLRSTAIKAEPVVDTHSLLLEVSVSLNLVRHGGTPTGDDPLLRFNQHVQISPLFQFNFIP